MGNSVARYTNNNLRSLPSRQRGWYEVCNLIIFIQSKQTGMPFIVFPDDYLQTAILKN